MPLPHATTTPNAPQPAAEEWCCPTPPPPAPADAPPTPRTTTTTTTTNSTQHPALASDLIFATFWVAPGIAPEDYASRRPDLRFGSAIRAAHAGKRVHVAVLTDAETTVLDDGGSGGDSAAAGGEVEVFRCADIDRARVGRNSYANYAQMVAQKAYLAHLEGLVAGAAGSGGPAVHPPVVFCDTDILFVGDVSEVFEEVPPGLVQTAEASVVPPPPAVGGTGGGRARTPYDYGLTISDSVDMPINFGVQFVPAGAGPRARAFLDGVCGIYDFTRTFVAGQEAIADFTGVMDRAGVNAAVRAVAYGPAGRCLKGAGGPDGHGVGAAPGASYSVAFFPCLRWNHCNCGQSCCTDPARGSAPIPKTAAEYAAAKVRAVHFVGHRKAGLTIALAAFARGGAAAAYEAIAALPDEEGDYVEAFGADAVASGHSAAVDAAVARAVAAAEASAAAAGVAEASAAAAAAVTAGAKAAGGLGAAAVAAAASKAAAAVVAEMEEGKAGVGGEESMDAGLAPSTAPASRDPSPPRKKAVVEVA